MAPPPRHLPAHWSPEPHKHRLGGDFPRTLGFSLPGNSYLGLTSGLGSDLAPKASHTAFSPHSLRQRTRKACGSTPPREIYEPCPGCWASLDCSSVSSMLIPCPGQSQTSPKTRGHGHVLPVEMGCAGLGPRGLSLSSPAVHVQLQGPVWLPGGRAQHQCQSGQCMPRGGVGRQLQSG